MSTKFFTNTDENTLLNKFKGVFNYNNNIKYFDAIVAYFRTSGYIHLRDFLTKLQKVRILVGINVDKLISDAYKDISEYFAHSKKIKEEFLMELKDDIQKANYDKETEKSYYQLIEDLNEKRIEIKAHPHKNIHAKVYILRPEPFNEHTPASVITGSSNFTSFGLGAGNKYNYEFNVQLNDYDDVKFATDEFEKLWSEAIEILPEDINKIKKDTYLNDNITPFELYVKLLIDYFDKNIDYDPDSLGDLPHNFKKLAYQIDAVNYGFNILMKYNGLVLADVVGLGKTVIATMVAKKFLIKNGRENTKILVVYPPALEKNWKNTFRYFDIDKYAKFISSGSLDKIEDTNNYWSKEEYDLVIVDEAHKFRNNKSAAYEKLQLICKSQRINKGNIEGKQKKVILVTATPLNNKPEDIFNQILLFQDKKNYDLDIPNLSKFFNNIISEYKSLKRDENLDLDKLRNIYKKIREKIIQPITVRRTRRDLENMPQYKKDLMEQGINFPKVLPPKKIEYLLDEKLNELFDMTVFYLTDKDKISYARYRAIDGLKKDIAKDIYETANIASQNLAYIMKTQMIKRLESSFYAFKQSLDNFKKATDLMIKSFKNNKIYISPYLKLIKTIDKDWSDEEIDNAIKQLNEEDNGNKYYEANDFEDEYIKELEKDKNLIDELVTLWNQIDYDPKLDVFLEQIDTTFFDKKINREGKLVIFTESSETVNYLTSELKNRGRKDVLAVSANNRNKLFDTILANFDANLDVDKQRNDYNIIISTEVLSEGINLHRSNVIIHYDTPWNSIKLLQRIGRVNRIGTKADTIYNFVFYPSAQGDSQINLNKTALMKIQAFHTAYGEDIQVYSDQEILDSLNLTENIELEKIEIKLNNIIKKYYSNPIDINDTTIGKIYLQLGNHYHSLNKYQNSFSNYYKSIEVFKKASNDYNLSKVYTNLGLNYIDFNQYDSALFYLTKSKGIKQKIGDDKGLSAVSNNLGILKFWQGKYKESIAEFYNYLNYSILNNDTTDILAAYQNIAGLYYTLKDFNQALSYYFKVLEFGNKVIDKFQIPDVYYNIGNVYKSLKDIDKSIKYYTLAIENSKKHNLEIIFLNSSIQLSEVFFEKGDIHSAKEVLKNISSSVQNCDNKFVQINYKITLSQILSQTKNYKNSNDVLNKIIQEYNNENLSINHLRTIYFLLSNNYEGMGKYQLALDYWKKFKNMDDSLKYIESEEKLKELDYESKTKIKEKEKQTLYNEKQQKQQIINYLIVIIVVVLFSSIAFLTLYIQYRKLNKKLFLQNDELENLNFQLNQALSTKEKFIQVISHDLKNSINSFKNISTLILNRLDNIELEKLKLFLTEMNRVAFQSYYFLDNLLNWSIANTFQINIFKEQINFLKLIDEIKENFQFDLIEKNILILVIVKDEKMINTDYRIISTILRNLISNSIKNTKPNTKIEVSFETMFKNGIEQYKITVKDYGKGISEEMKLKLLMNSSNISEIERSSNGINSGLGFKIIKSFVEILEGNIEIDSKINEYTIITIYFKT